MLQRFTFAVTIRVVAQLLPQPHPGYLIPHLLLRVSGSCRFSLKGLNHPTATPAPPTLIRQPLGSSEKAVRVRKQRAVFPTSCHCLL